MSDKRRGVKKKNEKDTRPKDSKTYRQDIRKQKDRENANTKIWFPIPSVCPKKF